MLGGSLKEKVRNFFISYNKADRAWAEWIAWELEEAGYTTVLQAWDFRPAENFVLKMNQAICESERTVAVLSSDYLKALFTQAEWASAFAQDPTNEKGMLIPVRVGECDLKGLFNQIIYIDLVEKEEEEARKTLLGGIQKGRAKPLTKPDFPGTAPRTVRVQPKFPGIHSRKSPKKLPAKLLIALTFLILVVIIVPSVHKTCTRFPEPIPLPTPCPRADSPPELKGPPGPNINVKGAITSGKKFKVVFDKLETKIGSIIPNGTYEILYTSTNQSWTARGPVHNINNIQSYSRGCGPGTPGGLPKHYDPADNLFTIWGAPFAFDKDGNVYNAANNYILVGRISWEP